MVYKAVIGLHVVIGGGMIGKLNEKRGETCPVK